MSVFETQVIDDIVPGAFQETLFRIILGGDWIFLSDVSGTEQEYPSMGFTQPYRHPEHGIVSPIYEALIVPLANQIITKLNLDIVDMNNARSFLQLPLQKPFIKPHNTFHVDTPQRHLAAVYYVNDSDGDTIILKNKFDTSNPVQDIEEEIRVTPKMGRLVIFDGSKYHASSQPKTNMRCIINMNMVLE